MSYKHDYFFVYEISRTPYKLLEEILTTIQICNLNPEVLIKLNKFDN